MEFKDLQCFVALVEELNFTRAAARAHMAQPPFSARIKRLEGEIGVRLFDRTNKSVCLTDAGATFDPLARELLSAAKSAMEMARQVEQGVAGRVLLGAIYSSVYRAIPDIVKVMGMQYPAVELHVEEMSIEAQIVAIRKRTIDGGILRLMRREPGIETIPLFSEDYVVAINNQEALAARASVSLADLADRTLIAFESSYSPEYDSMVFSAFAAERLVPSQVRRVRSMHMILGLVSAGIGVSIVPASLAEIGLKHVTYVPLKNRLPPQDICLAWLASSPPPIIKRLVNIVPSIRWNW
ncbi:LysR substrate-binding domain-containing protein [Paraburkholderia sediminicola]|uniref:LysR substrate-binding domain-containing protein n=1 Tax=Paraburkholderia sediminicola TaxID=458836 RepID=UPI0038BE08CB